MNLTDVQNKEDASAYVDTRIGMLIDVKTARDVENNEWLMEKLVLAVVKLEKRKRELLGKKDKMHSGDANEIIGINYVTKQILEVYSTDWGQPATKNTKTVYAMDEKLGEFKPRFGKSFSVGDVEFLFGDPPFKLPSDESDEYDETGYEEDDEEDDDEDW